MPARNVSFGSDVTIADPDLANLYGCSIGSGTRIGRFVEVQRNSSIGNGCRILSNAFICEGVTIEADVRIGHGTVFINDRTPRAVNAAGELLTDAEWVVVPTLVRQGAAIGANATILCGVEIGLGAVVGDGSVVTRDVPNGAIVVGIPARIVGNTNRSACRPAEAGETIAREGRR